MATTTWKNYDICPRKIPPKPPGSEVVISGIAGRFPESDNIHELRDNLMKKRDMVTSDDRRWKLNDPSVPQRTGKINKIEKFDALFFGLPVKQVNKMDPICRMLLEHTYEAIIDSGINPKQLRGSRTGVFIGFCFSESEQTWLYEKSPENGFGIMGCSHALLANRISYWLGIIGPSFTVDSACSSSLYALEQAYRAISEGVCDAAIVGTGNLCLHPCMSMQFYKLGVLSSDGCSKTFDESADGYARSEAVSVIFLQKAKDAKRVYATLVHGKVNCDGLKEEGITFPSTHAQSLLLKEFYMECGVPPSLISYVEAHGTGTKAGDPEEINAIDKALCESRPKDVPLLVGSIKSNIGHSEGASGLSSIAKVIIAMETGMIPPNIHFKNCKRELKAILEGRIKVVTEITPWSGGYIATNSFGFGGANAHVLLKSNDKEKLNGGAPSDDLPRLVVVSGRTEEAVFHLLSDLASKAVDAEYVALWHNIHAEEVSGHLYRGYTILPPQGIIESPNMLIEAVPDVKRPVWFVFSGMGSQWPGMGEALLRIPVFYEAIKKCDIALQPHGIDIFHIITSKDNSAFDVVLKSFVGIAAIQIGLVDVLFSLGIKPDNVIGHSVGELGCAYADGCFTAEQMILSAYFRGLASVEAKIIKGSMAAIGLGYKMVEKMCPLDINVACHNSSESSTISGPAESVKNFVAELTAKNIFAREVACSNIPYHSRYIAGAGPKLLGYLKKVIPSPKIRSSKWVSTSVPRDKWDTESARYCSAEYHTNNLLSSVLFEETSAMIPKDAVTIEIAPHGLLQAILKRSLEPSVTNIALAQRANKDNVEVLLQAIGKMFNVGLQPQLSNLYPAVEFPVSRSTPMISPLIKWDHTDDWYVASFKEKVTSGERDLKISLSDGKYESLAGHIIDGRNLFPATKYLTLIWETFEMMHGNICTELPVVFEDIKFLRATTLSKDISVELTLMIQKGTGRFEIVEGDSVLVTGFIRSNIQLNKETRPFYLTTNLEEELMTSKDVYKELRLRGYQYTGIYQSITRVSISGSRGHIAWNNDWAAFMDNMLQMKLIGVDTRGLFVPTAIKKLVINSNAHLSEIKFGETVREFEVTYNKLHDVITCGGVQIWGMKASAIPRRKHAGEPVIEEYKFVPFLDEAEVSLREIARLAIHIALENHTMDFKVKTVELYDNIDRMTFNNLLSPWISECLENLPLIQADTTVLTTKNDFEQETLSTAISVFHTSKASKGANALLVVAHQILADGRANNLNLLLGELKPGGFLLTREFHIKDIDDIAQSKGFHVVFIKKCVNEFFVLLRKREKLQEEATVIEINNESFDWVDSLRKAMAQKLEKETTDNAIIFVISQGDFDNGLIGLINCLRREPCGEFIRGILIQDLKAPPFSLEHPIYADQVQKGLAVNVLRKHGIWGTYRHLPFSPMESKPVQHKYVKQLVRGDLSSLTWVEGPINPNFKKSNLVNVIYASLNFRDVMVASGKLATEMISTTRLAQDSAIGFEFSGVDYSGKKIMGLIETRGLSNYCIPDRNLIWDIPEFWSLEDAATVPCAYGTCIYAFDMKATMKNSDKVLIHSGTGGIGQAAINLALARGCEVFTTVGTSEKRKFIHENFPQIRDDHIGNSRDTSFVNMIKELTNGRGVDIVLNSLSEDKLLASVECLAWGGKFLEIGKFDLMANNPLGMECFLREISFHGVMLDRMFIESMEMKLEFKKIMYEHLKNGLIKPLTRTVFTEDRVEEAFRYMTAGKHIGKVLINLMNKINPVDSVSLALPQYYCLNEKSYIILGGLGGVGLELADWMVLRGARNLIITSRTGIKNGYQKMRIELWKTYGVKVVMITGKDASSRQDCQFILETAASLAPVDGIFNLAVVLKDALWENQTSHMFEESFKVKAWATQNLDILTRKLCPQLRHFVVFSSVSCGRGNAGQSNYGMANSVMERICERRVAEGLPGLAVQWGSIGDVGLVADMQEENKELVIGGTLQQRVSSCFQVLEAFLQQDRPVVSSMIVAAKVIDNANTLDIVPTVQNIMGLSDLTKISMNAPLTEFGMDSMTSVEIKQTLEREFEIQLTAQDIRVLNFAKLQDLDERRKCNKKNKMDKSIPIEAGITVNPTVLARLIGNIESIHDRYCKLSTKKESNRNEIFLIPGIEGLSSVFDVVAPKIKAPATCLQLGDSVFDSILSIADSLLPIVLQKCGDCRTFEIVGYSFGAVVAIELVRRLEIKGLNGKLILIDGAPKQIKTMITQEMSIQNGRDVRSKCLSMMLNKVAPFESDKNVAVLQKCNTWEEKTQVLAKIFPSSVSIEILEIFCTSIYKKVIAIINYDVSQFKSIKAPITLLKPTIPTLKMNSEDYGLSEITRGTIRIHYVRGNHLTMLDDDKVALAINGELHAGFVQ